MKDIHVSLLERHLWSKMYIIETIYPIDVVDFLHTNFKLVYRPLGLTDFAQIFTVASGDLNQQIWMEFYNFNFLI